ncbi:MAG TPA: hypothetical protein VFX28_07885, partial [Methylomirabilota bacterium]|nr:hypothetical protein [Methylomirabilota bacterium]
APHLMIYIPSTLFVLMSFGVLAFDTLASWRRPMPPGCRRVLGITGPPGFMLAAAGITLAVLGIPADDLWHRLFGPDATVWSPPHLMGFIGAVANTAACWVIAREVYPSGSRARAVAMALTGIVLYLHVLPLQNALIRVGFTRGGIQFYGYAVFGPLLYGTVLLATTRLLGVRAIPLVVAVAAALTEQVGLWVSQIGFAIVQPEFSALPEEIARDAMTSLGALNVIAMREGTTPGRLGDIMRWPMLVPVVAMVLVDVRRRPVAAMLAYGAVLFAAVAVALHGRPAFQPSEPGLPVTVIAFVLTLAASVASAVLTQRLVAGLQRSSGTAEETPGAAVAPAATR